MNGKLGSQLRFMDKIAETFQTLGRYPVGDSDFPNIREKGQVYVDKTALLYRLTHDTDYLFLSRPRRFGKSLMLSTLKAYFQGRKELFDGLAMAELEKVWKHHPVIHLSMGGMDYRSIEALYARLHKIIHTNAAELGVECNDDFAENSFFELIRSAFYKYGEKVVLLIDEYDKPMLDTRHLDDKLHENVKNAIRGFYGVIKESAEYIRFVIITGVTKFSHVNIFSGLNNLRDISLNPEYNALCGISESEMAEYFREDYKVFAERNRMTPDEASRQFKRRYDGYRFASEGENIYNPFSVVNAFAAMKFGMYWYASGTSYYLVKEMEKSNFDFQTLEGISIGETDLMGVKVSPDNIVALLYQAGYLTIKDYEPEISRYRLGFPNKEVSSGFFNNLLSVTVGEATRGKFSAFKVYEAAIDGKPEEMLELLKYALSQYTYPQLDANATEKHFNLLMYTISMAIGLNVTSEINTSRGRIDMVIQTRRYIYIIEFKVNSYPKRAMAQINEMGYADKFHGDSRTIYKIGANFSKKTRTLTGWLIEKA